MNEEIGNGKTVLVTGGSGFIGSWVIIALLRRGYSVRATVRDLAREASVRLAIAKQVQVNDRLSFFAADLLRDDGWVNATAGVQYIMHVASPMPVGEYRKTDVIRPAREGTTRVLRAALHAGVERVVITSSLAAASPGNGPSSSIIDEDRWTDLAGAGVNDYTRAKTLAEQDAWAFMQQHSGSPMTLATVLPGMVLGPVLGVDYSGSVELITRMLTGKVPRYPRIGFSIVDVRDLVELHVRAMESQQAAGERFIGAGKFFWLEDITRQLRARLGARASKVPTRALPNFLVRSLAHVSQDLRFVAPLLGQRREYSSEKAARLLGWAIDSHRDTLFDTADSLLAQGLA